MAADITYSIDAHAGESSCSANTPAGEKFLGDSELVVPNEEAKSYVDKARAAGLTIVTFP
jgi:hypothetical protein